MTQTLRDRAAGESPEQPGTAAATTAPSIGGFLAELRPQLQRALPRHLDADRMARLALTVIRKIPDLALSTRESFAGALLTAAALGLEVGASGEAYLVPYEHRKGPLRGTVECQLIVGYAGLAKLYWQSPAAKHLDAQAVFERDEFDYAYGLGQYLRHKPASGSRGRVVAYYACAELTTGGSAFVVLSPEEVRALRGGKVGPSGSIPDPQRWMERKTALRQLLKMLPRSTILSTALVVDERGGTELYADRLEERREPAQLPAGTPDPTPDAPPDEPERDPWAPNADRTDAQSTKLHTSFTELGIVDRAAKLQYCSDVVGRDVESTRTLTVAECSRCIEALASDAELPEDPL